MTIRCLFGHELGGLVGYGNVLKVRCSRCDRLSPGIAIDGPKPRMTQPVKAKRKRGAPTWIRGVFLGAETKRAAQR